MLESITKQIQVVLDNKINDIAVLNVLQAKLNYVISFKGVRFSSIENVGRFSPLAYYAFNFVPSGGIKNRLLTEINNHVVGFFDAYLDKYNQDRLNQLECKHTMDMHNVDDKVEMRRKKAEQELEVKRFERLKHSLGGATQAKIYSALEIITNTGNGSILLENTEFVNFYEDAILNKDKMKKEFLDMLYNLWDGEFSGTDTVSTNRDNIKNIPTSAVFLSDFKLILENERITNTFKSYLARGMARRSFIYFNKAENYYLKGANYSSLETKQEALTKLADYSKKLENIFSKIEINKQYIFSTETNLLVIKWKKQVDKRISEFYKYTKILDNDTEILKLNIEHSTWKIIKLAVLYHILELPESSLVQPSSFNKACEFFEKTHTCLENLFKNKLTSDHEKLYNFLIKRRNNFVSKTDLRKEKFVSDREFAKWLVDAVGEIINMTEGTDLEFCSRVTGKRNTGYEVCLYDRSLYQFNASFDGEGGKIVKGELVEIARTGRVEVMEL